MTSVELLGRDKATVAEAADRLMQSFTWMKAANDRSPREFITWGRLIAARQAALCALWSALDDPVAVAAAADARAAAVQLSRELEQLAALYEGPSTVR